MNIFKYFALYANQHEFEYQKGKTSENLMDKWVIARVTQAAESIDRNISAYLIPKAIAEMKPLVDDISTWYIRRSRDRFVAGDTDALQTLFEILLKVTKLFAPVTPFITDFMYKELRELLPKEEQKESVHLEYFPEVAPLTPEEQKLLDTMATTRTVASLAQSIRVEKGLALKQPLSILYYNGKQQLGEEYLTVIAEELNVQKVLSVDSVEKSDSIVTKEADGITVAIETKMTPELVELGTLRDIIRSVQAARKEAQLELGDLAAATFVSQDEALIAVAKKYSDKIMQSTGLKSLDTATEETTEKYVIRIN
jgi:isoleucyl-tRNA synthetase